MNKALALEHIDSLLARAGSDGLAESRKKLQIAKMLLQKDRVDEKLVQHACEALFDITFFVESVMFENGIVLDDKNWLLEALEWPVVWSCEMRGCAVTDPQAVEAVKSALGIDLCEVAYWRRGALR
jgi:hypothetical protein